MKTVRRILILALTLLTLTSMIACSAVGAILKSPKDFAFQEMVLTLDSSFTEMDVKEHEDRTTFFSLSAVSVIIIKESFEEMADNDVDNPSQYSVADYQKAFITSNAYDVTYQSIEGLSAYTYESESDGDSYKFLVCTYKSETAFWSVQFMSPAKDYEKNEAQFIEWAKAIRFEAAA